VEVHDLGTLTCCEPLPNEVFARSLLQTLRADHFITSHGVTLNPEDRWHNLVAFTIDRTDERLRLRHFPILETNKGVGFFREGFEKNQQWKVCGTLAESLEPRYWRTWVDRVTTMMRLGMPIRDIEIKKEDLGTQGHLVKVAFAYPDHVALRNTERILISEGCKGFSVTSQT
jgi:hypothetical protein